jgi:hypothetical protein
MQEFQNIFRMLMVYIGQVIGQPGEFADFSAPGEFAYTPTISGNIITATEVASIFWKHRRDLELPEILQIYMLRLLLLHLWNGVYSNRCSKLC